MKAVLCPVCGGKGKLFIANSATIDSICCHGCNGTGWVEVHDDNESVVSKLKFGLVGE